ncbi:MAG: peptide chain release factor 2 [Alphaproteobacteria bacterium]|nr:peptide chain release factor 2 [Alphaproteobacteria bacterium]
MRTETELLIKELKQAIDLLRRHLDWENAIKELANLNQQLELPNFWDNTEHAQAVMRNRQMLENNINELQDFENSLNNYVELIELAEQEGDLDLVAEAETGLKGLQQQLKAKQIKTLLSGEADSNDSYLEIHAGAGGTESQDWASMLLRMYSRWAEKHGMKIQLLEIHAGEEAGIKSATILVSGHNAYGMLKTESGVHRLVRISPFDSNARRHTSFSSIWAYPVIDDNITVELNESEVRIDTYRASGAGGQHINTTDSAVRITHIKTGIVVQCQAERSQHRNKAAAWAMLRSRLYELELQKREEEANKVQNTKTDIGWGHQIRSYVLQPYQSIKDLRTNFESTNTKAVLDGDIDGFIEASLAARIYEAQ